MLDENTNSVILNPNDGEGIVLLISDSNNTFPYDAYLSVHNDERIMFDGTFIFTSNNYTFDIILPLTFKVSNTLISVANTFGGTGNYSLFGIPDIGSMDTIATGTITIKKEDHGVQIQFNFDIDDPVIYQKLVIKLEFGNDSDFFALNVLHKCNTTIEQCLAINACYLLYKSG